MNTRTLLSRYEARLVAAAKRHPKHHVDPDGNHTIPVAARPLQEAIFIQLANKKQPNLVNKGTDNRWDAITLDDQVIFALTVLSRIDAHYNSPGKREEGEAVLDHLDKSIHVRTYALMAIVYAEITDALLEAKGLPSEAAVELLKDLHLRILKWRGLARAKAVHAEAEGSDVETEEPNR